MALPVLYCAWIATSRNYLPGFSNGQNFVSAIILVSIMEAPSSVPLRKLARV
jgi:hypothetical protein